MTTNLLEVPDFEDLNIKILKKKFLRFPLKFDDFPKSTLMQASSQTVILRVCCMYVHQVPESITT